MLCHPFVAVYGAFADYISVSARACYPGTVDVQYQCDYSSYMLALSLMA